MICQNCQREFTATKHSRICAFCDFDNGLSRFASAEHRRAMKVTRTPFAFRETRVSEEDQQDERLANEHPHAIDFPLDHDEPSQLES